MNTSNKFAVLQVHQPQQPRPKGDKLVASISGPVSNVPKHSIDQVPSDKEKQNSSDRVNNNNNRSVRGGGERGRGRGARGGRGGNRGCLDRATQDKLRDPNAPPKRNKRIYDKNSNVPKNENKKGGQGTGNWGNEKDEPRGADDAKKEITEGEQVVEPKNEVPEEVEEKTITLKEYQEQRAALAPKIEAPKRREAGEGEKSDLHKYTVLKKDDEEEEKLHIKPKKEKAKKQNKKQTISISQVEITPSSGDDRRGPRKFNNNNNFKKSNKKVNIPIEDTDSFPALK